MPLTPDWQQGDEVLQPEESAPLCPILTVAKHGLASRGHAVGHRARKEGSGSGESSQLCGPVPRGGRSHTPSVEQEVL